MKNLYGRLIEDNMRYVILRDDDTNAFTPVECLERLYRPFLERGPAGEPRGHPGCPHRRRAGPTVLPEQFLFAKNGSADLTMPVGDNEKTRSLSP